MGPFFERDGGGGLLFCKPLNGTFLNLEKQKVRVYFQYFWLQYYSLTSRLNNTFPPSSSFLPLFRLDRKRTIESFDQKRDWGSGETISTQTNTTKH